MKLYQKVMSTSYMQSLPKMQRFPNIVTLQDFIHFVARQGLPKSAYILLLPKVHY